MKAQTPLANLIDSFELDAGNDKALSQGERFISFYPLLPLSSYPLPTPKLQIPDKLIPRNYEAIAIQTHGMARY